MLLSFEEFKDIMEEHDVSGGLAAAAAAACQSERCIVWQCKQAGMHTCETGAYTCWCSARQLSAPCGEHEGLAE